MNTFLLKSENTAPNNDLYKINVLKFMVHDAVATQPYIAIDLGSNKTFSCSIVGTGHFTNNTGEADYGQQRDFTNARYIFLSTDVDGIIYLTNSSAITYISTRCLQIDISQFRNSNITELRWATSGLVGNLDENTDITKNITALQCILSNTDFCSLYGHLTGFNEEITIIDVRYSKGIVGEFTDLGKYINLSWADLTGTSITGNSDDLADELYTNGKSSGTLTLTLPIGSTIYYDFAEDGWTKR